jgi:hypothetical protein
MLEASTSGPDPEHGSHPVLRYRFDVEGKTYEGTLLSHSDEAMQQADAEAVVARYPAGSEVTVYFDPSHPKRCVLEPGKEGPGCLIAVFALAELVFGTWLLWSTLNR